MVNSVSDAKRFGERLIKGPLSGSLSRLNRLDGPDPSRSNWIDCTHAHAS